MAMSFNKCAGCDLTFSNSVYFMQHCVNIHNLEVPEIRALYNVRPLFFSRRKNLVCKFLGECSIRGNVRTDVILSILYLDPTPVVAEFYNELEDRMYSKALNLAKHFQPRVSKRFMSSEEKSQLKFLHSNSRRDQNTLLDDKKLPLPQSPAARPHVFGVAKEVEDINELKKRPCECKSEMRVVADRMVSIEEKSLSMMLALRTFLEATNKAIPRPQTSICPNTPKQKIEAVNILSKTISKRKYVRKSVMGTTGDDKQDSGLDADYELKPELSPVKNIFESANSDTPPILSQQNSAELIESQENTDSSIVAKNTNIDSVVVARLLLSNWLSEGPPRIKGSQLFHPIEERMLTKEELSHVVGRAILLSSEMLLNPKEFVSRPQPEWIQFVAPSLIKKVFQKLEKDGLIYEHQDSYYKNKKRFKLKKNLEYQLKLAEYALTTDEYYYGKSNNDESQT